MTVNSGHGDVTAAGLGAGVNDHIEPRRRASEHHSQARCRCISPTTGATFSAHEIDGDLTADGNCNDLTFSEIKGKVTLNGEIFGDVHMENIAGPMHLHTSVTELADCRRCPVT